MYELKGAHCWYNFSLTLRERALAWKSRHEDNGFRAFLLGVTSACPQFSGKTARAWQEIQSRDIECYDTEDKDLGFTVRPHVPVKAGGFLFVYGGGLLDRTAAEDGRPKSHLRRLTDDLLVDGIHVRKLPQTHWAALCNSNGTPNAKFETLQYDSVRNFVVVQAGSKDIKLGEPITIDYAVLPSEMMPPHRHSRTGESITYSRAEMKAWEPTHAMTDFNERIASRHTRRLLSDLVRVVPPTPERAAAAKVVAMLLDSASFDTNDGVRWDGSGSGGKRLSISGVVCNAFEGYGLVVGDDAATVEEQETQQRDHTLRIQRKGYDALVAKRDALSKKGLGMAQLDQLVSNGRLGAAFVIAYAYLMEQMQQETQGGPVVDSHGVDSVNPFSAFGWHPDDHAEQDAKPGPYIEHTVVCLCSPGQTSMAVAGYGEVEYPGVGGFVLFPAWALHRTRWVKPTGASMWKIAGFFEPCV